MENSVPHFFKEIKDRTLLQFKPFNDLYFTYFFFFVLIIGGIGIWISLIKELQNKDFNHEAFVLNVGTYYLVLITTSYIDLTTNEKILNKKSLHIYPFILLILIGGIFGVSFYLPQGWSIFVSLLGLILSLFLWHLANCDNNKFTDESYNSKMKTEAADKHGKSW